VIHSVGKAYHKRGGVRRNLKREGKKEREEKRKSKRERTSKKPEIGRKRDN
jgi:hypothetical protein